MANENKAKTSEVKASEPKTTPAPAPAKSAPENTPAPAPAKSAADVLLEMQLAEATKRSVNPLAVVSDVELDEDDQRRNDVGARSHSIKTFANGSTVTRWK